MQTSMFHQPTKPTKAPPMAYPHTPASRPDDTSQQAARDLAPKAHTIRAQVLEVIQAAPRTTDECAEILEYSILSVRPRFSELRKMGLIEDSTERRLNATSGKRVIVWRKIAPEARQLPRAYRELIAREERRKNERRGVTV
jgi:hypothetical protein